MKRHKENLKEEEKLALKTAEVSATSKTDRKRALNEAKADNLAKRQQKVIKTIIIYNYKYINNRCCFINNEYNHCRIRNSQQNREGKWKLN